MESRKPEDREINILYKSNILFRSISVPSLPIIPSLYHLPLLLYPTFYCQAEGNSQEGTLVEQLVPVSGWPKLT